MSPNLKTLAAAILAAAVEPEIRDGRVRSATFVRTPAVDAAVVALARDMAADVPPPIRSPKRLTFTISARLREIDADAAQLCADDVEDGLGGARPAFVFFGGDLDNQLLFDALAADRSWAEVPFTGDPDALLEFSAADIAWANQPLGQRIVA